MYKLLIIDDEEKIVEGMGSLFPWQSIGFEVVGQFTDGQKALDYIGKNEVHVVLTDIEMPGMNGLELSRALMAYKGLKVVLFSSYSHYEYFRGAIQNNVADYLIKPINYAALLECFERIRTQLDGEKKVVNMAPTGYYEKIVYDVMAYLKENYQNASLEEAAVLVNLSPSYLSKIFKEKSGRHFSDMLLSIRMDKACEMLANPKYKGYDVAYYVGYDNPKNFSRAFKSFFGISATEYRTDKLGGPVEE